MSPLREALTSYLTIRRALGDKLVRAGKLLTQFVAYMEDVGAKTVTTEHAIAWAKLPAGGGVNWWGAPAVCGSMLRHLSADLRSKRRGARSWRSAGPAAARNSLPVFRRRNQLPNRSLPLFEISVACGNLQNPARPFGRYRLACRRSHSCRSRRHRLRSGFAHGERGQVRQVPRVAAASDNTKGPALLPA